MEKEYGKLTEDQFRRFVRHLPDFRREYAGFEETMRAATPERLRELLGDGINRALGRGCKADRERQERERGALGPTISPRWQDGSLGEFF
jgi:hypothetical protein